MRKLIIILVLFLPVMCMAQIPYTITNDLNVWYKNYGIRAIDRSDTSALVLKAKNASYGNNATIWSDNGLNVETVDTIGFSDSTHQITAFEQHIKDLTNGDYDTIYSGVLTADSTYSAKIDFTVYATDGTKRQALKGYAFFSAIVMGGVLTEGISYEMHYNEEAQHVANATTLVQDDMKLEYDKTTGRLYVSVKNTSSLVTTKFIIQYIILHDYAMGVKTFYP